MKKDTAPRYPVNIPIQLRATTGSLRGATKNISESGILVQAAGIPQKGARIRLEPLLAGGYAEVVWVRESAGREKAEGQAEIGLKFVDLTYSDKENISALVSSLARAARSRD